MVRKIAVLVALVWTVALTGCATGPNARADDPFEPWNRAMYAINEPIDKNVVVPLVKAYVEYVPWVLRKMASNYFNNIEDLFSGINGTLQGKLDKAGNDFGRVIVNTFMGIGGLIDFASEAGIPRGEEDFGQTFGYWGIPQGPYLFVPFAGPTTVRDGTGVIIRIYLSPTDLLFSVPVRNVIWGIGAFDARAQYLDAQSLIEEASTDPYSYVRRAYLQRRLYQVYDGKIPPEKSEE
jgi:phospholipid-binding lipoprotein MlaA